jgi:propionyl-CoA carboxylase alpha chain/3-methylcrotonyl-CoA carboxylase alpha subunit
VEFIADASEGLRADRIWFMEMNTRLQVEHPVTEAITGLDLVEWQLRIAAGEPLPLTQEEIAMSGHAIEARLYAEQPATGFLPAVGPIDHLRWPSAVRVDAGVEEGGEVSPWYDPMIAKLIAHGPTREAALAALGEACDELEVWPLATNACFLARCLEEPDFIAGEVDTGFIEARLSQLTERPEPSPAALAAAAEAAVLPDAPDASPWRALAGFRLNAEPERQVRLYLGDGSFLATPQAADARSVLVTDEGQIVVFESGEAFAFTTRPPPPEGGEEGGGEAVVRAPMPGKVAQVAVEAGAAVKRGQSLVVLEAMKMEHALAAPFDGEVEEVLARAGDQVSEGAALLRLKAPA